MSATLVVTGTPNPSEMEAVQSYLKVSNVSACGTDLRFS